MDIFGIGIVNIPNWIIVFVVIFYVCHWHSGGESDFKEMALFLRNVCANSLTKDHQRLMTRNNVFDSMGIPVPYPKPLPLIGNSLKEFIYVVHELDVVYGKKYGRVYGFYEAMKPTLRVTDPTILREVLVKQFNHFTDRRKFNTDIFDPVLRKIMTVIRGEEWKMTRNVMSPTFTSGKLKHMVALVNKCSERFVKMLAEKAANEENVDAKGVYIAHLLEIVGTCAFGIELNNNEDKFVKSARRVIIPLKAISFLLLFILPKRLRDLFGINFLDVTAMENIKAILKTIIKARETGTERKNDFLQIMLDAVKEADTKSKIVETDDTENNDQKDVKAVLTPDGVLAQSFLFLLAGFETTSTTLSFISYTAATNQDCQEKMIEEINRVLSENNDEITWDTIAQLTYMDMFILETLRMYPPAMRIDRYCSEDTMIGDLHIPKDFLVNIPIYAIHHDEEFYPDPYKFDPERFTPENKEKRNAYTYLAFGAGPRNCIGMRFALMELKVTLVHLFKNFRIVPSPKTQIPIVFMRGCMQLTPAGGIHVKFIKR